MKISEMTLEQLQDYALSQEQELASSKERESTLTAQITELTDLNKALQKRNNDLFIKVEQGTNPDIEQQKEKPIESCEDFARKLILGGNK